MEEEELANLRAQQRAFEELRNAELVEQQRLEEQERRHREEKVSAVFFFLAFSRTQSFNSLHGVELMLSLVICGVEHQRKVRETHKD